MRRLMFTLGALALSTPAFALDTYMWGVGPKLGSHFLPNRYPLAFPGAVTDQGYIDKVGFDMSVGADSVYYLGPHSRIGATTALGFGKGYFDANFIFKYDVVMSSTTVDFMVGAGAGFGTHSFRGEGDARLRVPNFPLRVEAAAMLPDQSRAYQLTLHGTYNVPSRVDYVDIDGVETEARAGLWLTIGLELTCFFGDFTAPQAKKNNRGNGPSSPM